MDLIELKLYDVKLMIFVNKGVVLFVFEGFNVGRGNVWCVRYFFLVYVIFDYMEILLLVFVCVYLFCELSFYFVINMKIYF